MSNPTDFPEPTLIPVNGVELEVFEAGQENAGNPIVLCHGWPEHAFSWRHQVPALAAAGYHVIVPNQRGYGNSSRPTEVTEYDIEHLPGDLIALLDHYGGYVNRCVNVIRRRPSQPLIQWRFHPHTVHRGRRLRSTQGPSDA